MKKSKKKTADPTIRRVTDARDIPATHVILSEHLKGFRGDPLYSTLSREAYRAKDTFNPMVYMMGDKNMGIFVDPSLVDEWVARWREEGSKSSRGGIRFTSSTEGLLARLVEICERQEQYLKQLAEKL